MKRPNYAGEIWKRSLINTVRLTIHSYSSRKRSLSKTITIINRFPARVFPSTTRPKWPVVVFLNSSRVVWTGNIWCVFGVKPLFSNSSSVVWAAWPQEHQHDWWSFIVRADLIDGYGNINRCFVSLRNKWHAWTPQQWCFCQVARFFTLLNR